MYLTFAICYAEKLLKDIRKKQRIYFYFEQTSNRFLNTKNIVYFCDNKDCRLCNFVLSLDLDMQYKSKKLGKRKPPMEPDR